MSEFWDEYDDDSPAEDEKPQTSTSNSVYEKAAENSKHVSQVINVHPEIAFMLLHLCNYDMDKLFDEYTDNKSGMLAKIGLSDDLQLDQSIALRASPKTESPLSCHICFDEKPSDEMYGLICGHYFCKECWAAHVDHSVSTGNIPIRCMEPDCCCALLPSDVELISTKENHQLYMDRLSDKSLSTLVLVKRCPNPRCNLVVKIEDIDKFGVITCSCGTRICWNCGERAHAPVQCEDLESWKKLAGEAGNDIWISLNTKKCTKCHTQIEKNGGCNHMTCGNCKHEFCWICGHDWLTHTGDPYSCSLAIFGYTEGVIEKSEERKRYAVERHIEHKMAQDNESNNLESDCNVLRTIAKLDEPLIHDIIAARSELRDIMMWSYAYTYFMESEQKLKLFQYVQKQGEIELEKLCLMIEVRPEDRAKFAARLRSLRRVIDVIAAHVCD